MTDESKLRKKLVDLATIQLPSDKEDFNAFDYSGGNTDDAYRLGIDSGYCLLARELLTGFFPAEVGND